MIALIHNILVAKRFSVYKFALLFCLALACTIFVSCDFPDYTNEINAAYFNAGGGSSSNSECNYGKYRCSNGSSQFCGYSGNDLTWLLSETCSYGCDSSTGKCKSASDSGSGSNSGGDSGDSGDSGNNSNPGNDTGDSGNNQNNDPTDTGAILPECSKTSGTPCIDSSSSLTWSKENNYAMSYSKALSYCDTYSEAGLTDWHLPNIDELRTLLIWSKSNSCQVSEKNNCLSVSNCWTCETCTETGDPAISNGDNYIIDYCFDWGTGYDDGRYNKLGSSPWLWSSSIQPDRSTHGWIVDFYHGTIESSILSGDRSVRCVR